MSLPLAFALFFGCNNLWTVSSFLLPLEHLSNSPLCQTTMNFVPRATLYMNGVAVVHGMVTDGDIAVTTKLAPLPRKRTTKRKKSPINSPKASTGTIGDDDPAPKRKQSKSTAKKAPSTSNARKKKSIKDKEPSYWLRQLDTVHFQKSSPQSLAQRDVMDTLESQQTARTSATETAKLFQCTVRGNPLPLRRHRTARGFVYNPSAAAQKAFRSVVEEVLQSQPEYSLSVCRGHNSTDTGIVEDSPLWDPEHALAATIVFRMKRPKHHFVAGRPGPGRLRLTAPRETCSSLRTDVDNLAKFVLDSLNGLLYADDRQIISLHVTKIYDNDVDELCRGSTCIRIKLHRDEDIPQLLDASIL